MQGPAIGVLNDNPLNLIVMVPGTTIVVTSPFVLALRLPMHRSRVPLPETDRSAQRASLSVRR